MGKRQIGELQPGELVITILLSEVASMPLQGDDYPLLSSIVLIFLFVALEIVSSVLSLKSKAYRKAIQGNSIMVIKDGRLLQNNLKILRYSIDDLFENLRLKDVFDLKQVDSAYVETNGALSVELKAEYKPPSAKELNLPVEKTAIPYLVVSDGKMIFENFVYCKTNKTKINAILKENSIDISSVLLMTLNTNGDSYIVRKREGKTK